MLVDFTMNNHSATAGVGSYQRRSPSPRPIQKTPSWTVSQHEDDNLGLAMHDSLDVAQQEPSSLSPLDAYENASPQGSHFSGAMSLFGSHSDLTTPGYGDDFLGETIGPMLTLNYNDEAPTPPGTTAMAAQVSAVQNDPAPVRQGLDPQQRPAVEATSMDELEKMRALDATKSEVRHWLHTTEPATDNEVAESDRLRVATLTKRQRAKSTGDANRRVPELHASPKPVAALSPEAYLNFDDDDDDDDDDNDDDQDDDDEDDQEGDEHSDDDDDGDEGEDGASEDEGEERLHSGTAAGQNESGRAQRSSTPPVRAESLQQNALVASPPALDGFRPGDVPTTASRGKPWADPDFALPIRTPSQPHTSSAAMAMFQQRARDIETASVSATIGSRRRSETDVSSLFSAAGISVKVPAPSSRVPVADASSSSAQRQRRPSLLSKVLPRRSSSNLKKRKDGEASPPAVDAPQNESSFAPPKRITSWGRAKSPARIDVSAPAGPMRSPPGSGGGNGTGSLGTPTAWQTAKAAVRRGRSPSGGGLADMLRQAGGPPVAHLPQTDDTPCPTSFVPAAAAVKDESVPQSSLILDTNGNSNKLNIVDDDDFEQGFLQVTTAVPEAATHAAFKEHILKLDSRDIMPHFMIERLAQEQVKRYKRLADSFQRHRDGSRCSAGALCSKRNPAPRFLPPKSVPKSTANKATDSAPVVFYVSSSQQTLDELSALDGSAVAATFPAGVPLPPVPRLPAEFECPLCFQVKKIYKPSDWTKHVHEDVQPFTCTFPNCAETKSFKRKADWVRHENERHRHLEKWECSINSCGHQCFRKNNFQEHLVREHKLPEIRERRPTATSVATNAPESGVIMDLIESCHVETTKQPTDEPCRFCSERCTTWKKLHVHLAAHLLSISMPILEMQGLGDIKLPPPHSASVKQTAQLLSDNEDGSQNSFSRNISSSPSATRSPAVPFGADYSSRAVNTYPPPAMAYDAAQYQLASQSSFNYTSDHHQQQQQHHDDTNQDPSFLTTPLHTYPPPGVGHSRSRSATRSPTESWLNPDFSVASSDLTPANLAMQGQLGVSAAPPRQSQQQQQQQQQQRQHAQAMVYSQSAQGFPTPQTDHSFFQSSPSFTSTTPQLGLTDFPTPVSHARSQAQSQSQSRLVSPTPQHNAVSSGMAQMHGMAYATNGTTATTYPTRTTTADDMANNIQIVRRQLALEQQQQQQRRDPQLASRTQQQHRQLNGHRQQQTLPQQQQQQQQQQQAFFAEPLEGDFSAGYVNQQQENDWLSQMYSAQQNQAQVQQQQQQHQQHQQQYNLMQHQQDHPHQLQQQHQQPHSGLGTQIPYTSAPGGW